ncbi:MAG: nucleotidyltransferase domain-containing protein [Candidatus Micrarchaeota archaeon]
MFKKLNLFSKTEIKLLSFISFQDRELYEREIAIGAKISVGSVNSILKKLSSLGLVIKSKKGKMLFYRRNDSNPVLRQFKIFVNVSLLFPLVKKLVPISKRIVLFGSCAEGRNGETSDIDLFILTSEKDRVKKILRTYNEIQGIVMNSVEYSNLRDKDRVFYDNINKGIELGDEIWMSDLGDVSKKGS